MKKFITIVACCISCITGVWSQQAPNKITGEVIPELSQVDRWVYLVELNGYNYGIIDSCFIKKNDTSFQLEGVLAPHAMNMIAFSESGPVQALIYLMPGESVHLIIDSDDKMYYPSQGSESNRIDYEITKEIADTRKLLNLLNDEFNKHENENPNKSILADSISFVQKEFDYGIKMRYLPYITHPGLYYDIVEYRLKRFLNEEDFQEQVRIMKEKFPSDEKIQAYPKNIYAPPESPEGKWARNRYREIINHNYIAKGDEPLFVTSPKRNYEIGTHIENLILPDTTGKDVALYDIDKEYILVDFWASWCIPCRKEIPYLKEALSKYSDKLSILAVSIDSTKEPWIKAIGTDKSDEFTHVFLGNGDEGKKLLAEFGISSIPANFLLDSDFKIIATDLREEQLDEILRELL